MASGAPMMNGDISRGPGPAAGPSGTLEETLQQMNILIQENRDLKEALRHTNLSMKERFEGLSAWKERQREEREFLEGRLEEARRHMEALTTHNQVLGKKVEELERAGGRGQSAELDALRAQVARLQAEKNDLVAMNSELQLKMGQGSPENSFIEIIRITDGDAEGLKDVSGAGERSGRLDVSMTASRQESEELTVSQLLHSLRGETQKVERLEIELQASKARITELEEKESCTESSTQTSLRTETTTTATMATETEEKIQQGDFGKEEKAASEVENLKAQTMILFKELQQAQSKLDEAEGMKKNMFKELQQAQSKLDEAEGMKKNMFKELQQAQSKLDEAEGMKKNMFKELQQAQSKLDEAEGMKKNMFKELQQAQSKLDEAEGMKKNMFKELQQAQSKLDEAEGMKKNLQDRCREVEQDVVTLRAQLVEKQAVQAENDRLKLQLDSMHAQSQLEQRKTGEERNNLVQLKDAYTKLFEDYNELKEERKRRESQLVSKEVADDLRACLATAEQALAAKQDSIDAMKQEIYQKEQELETISVFQAQAEVYSSDFYAERAAREKIHQEKEDLATQLEYVKKQRNQLQEEMDSLGRQALNEMKRKHNPHVGAGAQGGRGDWQQQGNIQEHVCPKCEDTFPDLDSLQIHIMDCII